MEYNLKVGETAQDATSNSSPVFNPKDSRWRRECDSVCIFLLWIAIVSYIIIFIRQSFFLYDRFALTAYDLGIFDQATWLISHGYPAFVTVRGLHLMADHFSAILYFLVPLYWIWDSPRTLLTVQTVALALGALPIYSLAKQRTGLAPIAFLLAISYLLYPAIQWTNTFDFHPEVLATPVLISALYFLSSKKWGWYLVMIGLSALTKETAGITLIAMGIYALFIDRKIGLATMGMGVLSLVTAMGTLYYFNQGKPSPYWMLYSQYGSTPTTIAIHLFEHPFRVASDLTTDSNRQYLVQMLQPVIFLPLLAPEILLIAAPSLLINLLSNRWSMHTIFYQYTAMITPFIFVAAVIGIDRIKQKSNLFTTTLVSIYLGFYSLEAIQLGPLIKKPWPLVRGLSGTQARNVLRIIRNIPPDASVSAQSALVPHLSHRLNIYTFPNPFYPAAWGNSVQALMEQQGFGYSHPPPKQLERDIDNGPVEYVIICSPGTIFPLSMRDYIYSVLGILDNPTYGIIAINKNTILLRRNSSH